MQQSPETPKKDQKAQDPKAAKEIKQATEQECVKPDSAKPISQDEKDKKIEELTDTAKRVQAEFENYKKRADKEQQNLVKLGKAKIIRKLLPVLDTFDNALKQNPEDNGLKLVHQQLTSALESEGVREIKTEGKLDPYRHECLEEECSHKERGHITEEIQKGYMLDDTIIRHSLVKVSSGKKEEAQEKKEAKQ